MLLRTIILSKKAESIIDFKKDEFTRLDDVIMALEWRLSRNPETGIKLKNGLWLLKSADDIKGEGIPTILASYEILENSVEILDIRIESQNK